jgi:hypothetical protein
MGMSDTPRSTTDFDHHSEQSAADPWGTAAKLASKCPMAWSEKHGGYCVISGHEEVREAARAAEIERCLAQHPAVREAAIIGIPDETWVQSVKAIVVVDAQSAVTQEELIEHCHTRLAPYKKPRSVVLRQEALPRVGPAIHYESLDAAYGGGNYPDEGTRSV